MDKTTIQIWTDALYKRVAPIQASLRYATVRVCVLSQGCA